MNRVRTPHRLRGRLGQPEKPHLPRTHQIRHRSDGLLDRHRAIDAVLIVQVDVIDAEASQRGIARGLYVFGPAVLADELAVGSPHVAEFRGQDDSLAPPLDRLPDQDLVGEGAVDIGRVEEIDAQIQGPVNRRDGLRVIPAPVEVRHPHAPEAQGRYLRALLAEFALFHDSSEFRGCCVDAI